MFDNLLENFCKFPYLTLYFAGSAYKGITEVLFCMVGSTSSHKTPLKYSFIHCKAVE